MTNYQPEEKPRCLIAEDNLTCRAILTGFLKSKFECDYATNGKETIKLFRESHEKNRPYSLICLDIAMPQVDGLEALRDIRQYERISNVSAHHETKVFMITAISSPSAVCEAMYNGGAQGYIVKPLSVKVLNTHFKQAGLPIILNSKSDYCNA